MAQCWRQVRLLASEVDDEAEARQFGDNDPSVTGGLNRFEIHPMRLVASREKGKCALNA